MIQETQNDGGCIQEPLPAFLVAVDLSKRGVMMPVNGGESHQLMQGMNMFVHNEGGTVQQMGGINAMMKGAFKKLVCDFHP